MAAIPVEAVWVWFFGTTAQKATYGRINDQLDKSFTKDYLQASGECSKLFDLVMPTPPGSDSIDITYQWPLGSASGSIKHPNDRHHLRWLTSEGVPAPWRLNLSPKAAGPETLPGDPSKNTNIRDAVAALAEYEAQGLDGYLVAVKLVGEENILHIRAYIKDPPAEYAFADTALLPLSVQEIIANTSSSRACSSKLFNSVASSEDSDLTELLKQLEENPNLLLIGPPGTGKSVTLDKLARYVEKGNSSVSFDPDKNHDAWLDSNPVGQTGKAVTVVLHPSYSYDNLVVGLLPKASNGGVAVGAVTGPLTNLAHYTQNGNRGLLVLDEFNRANSAAVLGDTLALLDKDKRGIAHVDLPAYGLPMQVPDEYAVDGNRLVSSRLTLPKSLWVVAAMNSSDRSVAPLDAALRRRFSIVEIGPDYDLLARRLNADDTADFDSSWDSWTPGIVSMLAVKILESLNARIEAALGRDFVLGHSNFWHIDGSTSEEVLRSIARAWDQRIVQTLRLALQDDEETLAFILQAGPSSNATSLVQDRAVWWKKANSSFEQFARPRIEFNKLEFFHTSLLLSELKRLAGL